MKKLNLLIPVLLVCGLISCGNEEEATSSPSTTEPTTSITTSTSSKAELTVDDLKEVITLLKTNTNYTITLSDSDGNWVRRYLPNAYYYDAPSDFADKESIGYAENDTGIFSYMLSSDVEDITINPSLPYYFENEDGELLHGLYSAKASLPPYYNAPTNFAYSFELFDLSALDSLKASMAAPGMYEIDSASVIKLLPAMDQQNYYNPSKVKTRIGFDKNGNIVIDYKGEWSQSQLIISDIGTTVIPYIQEYIAAGKGANVKPVDTTPAGQIKTLLNSLNYKVTKDDSINYVVTESYVHVVEADNLVHGYVVIPEENTASLSSGVYEYTVNNSTFTLGTKTSFESIKDTYYAIPKEIMDDVVWNEAKYAYYLSIEDGDSSFGTLIGYNQYFHEDLYTRDPYYNTYIGELFVTYSNLEDPSNTEINFLGKHYEADLKTGLELPTGGSNSIRMYDFNATSNKTFAAVVEDYLASIIA